MIVAEVLGQEAFRRRTLANQVVAVLGGAGLLALSGRAGIPLPWTPVPVTAQTLAVLLVGALLGSVRGSLSVLTYLAAGTAQLPVFAHPAGLAGPTGGYLLGFAVSAFLTGTLFERGWGRSKALALLALLLGTAAIFAVGVPWLAFFRPPSTVLREGLLYFLPGECVKITLAALLLNRLGR